MEASESRFKAGFDKFRHSNRLAVFIVYATLMVDNMLLTCVVPILPEYFFHEEAKEFSSLTGIHEVSTRSLEKQTTEGQTTETTHVSRNGTGSECLESRNKQFLAAENLFLAFLLASKPFIQAIANIAVGPLTDRFGYDVPMFSGYIVLVVSSLIFAFGKTYPVLFFARALQGIGSACASTAGLAMLASRFPDDEERGKMMGIALGGLAMGVLIGPSFGSVTYELAGKETPFLVLAAASFIIGSLQLSSRQLQLSNSGQQGPLSFSIFKMLKDPFILLGASALMLGNLGIGCMETGLPIWMMTTMCAEKWMLGVATLPVSISYLIMTVVTPRIGSVRHRWIICLISYFVAAVGCVTFPQSKTFFQLFGPGILLGIAVGMVDATILPIMGNLADIRHASIYGSVYAIADASFCFAFIIGPLLAGSVIRFIGFAWLMYLVAILNVIFAPFVIFLRNPPSLDDEKQAIINSENGDDTVSYDPQLSSVGRVMDMEK
ncbi:synaptic vesicular amine transporter-like [Styela clava]